MTEDLKAGPALDALIAEKVMGWKKYTFEREGSTIVEWIRPDGGVVQDFHPSQNVASAWEVAEKLKLSMIAVEQLSDKFDPDSPVTFLGWVVIQDPHEYDPDAGCDYYEVDVTRLVPDPSIAMAICRGAVRVLEEKESGEES